jgi:hypothetical protein
MDDKIDKKERIKEYKRQEYLKNADKIKARSKEYYYKKKKELGLPDKKDKYKIEVKHSKDYEDKSIFIVTFD